MKYIYVHRTCVNINTPKLGFVNTVFWTRVPRKLCVQKNEVSDSMRVIVALIKSRYKLQHLYNSYWVMFYYAQSSEMGPEMTHQKYQIHMVCGIVDFPRTVKHSIG